MKSLDDLFLKKGEDCKMHNVFWFGNPKIDDNSGFHHFQNFQNFGIFPKMDPGLGF